MANQREHSKINWNSRGTVEEINSGSLQRIADACELMAGNYVKLQNDYDYMRRDRDRNRGYYETEKKRSAAYRGVINKMNKGR